MSQAPNKPPIKSTPPAEVIITISLAQQLIQEQFPEFTHLEIQFLDEGWDNVMFRLGKKYLIRLPRRAVAVALLQHEQKWLPDFAKKLPIDIPAPIRLGQPSEHFKWPWSILPWFDGQSANLQTPANDQAKVFAQFLKTLHQPAAKEAPLNPSRGNLFSRKEDTEIRMNRLATTTEFITPKIWNIWNTALASPKHPADLWIHGDLHTRNIIVHQNKIRAIIDWGDLTSGDAATDLACWWMLFSDQAARKLVIKEYQPSNDLLARAKGWAVFFGVILLDTGLVDNPEHAEMGRQTLKNLLEGEY